MVLSATIGGMIAKVLTAAVHGYEGILVEVETDMKQGLPGIHIVGMGSKSVDEARERIRSAITHSSLDIPARKYVINLAPADLPKQGSAYDVALAIAVLTSTGQLKPSEIDGYLFCGELSLDGQIKAIRAPLHYAETAQKHGCHSVVVPISQVQQAVLVPGITVIGVQSLQELFLHLKGERLLNPAPASPPSSADDPPAITIDDVIGQAQAKRALQIAAAGHHNLLLFGPPGAGKSMLAQALQSILPALETEEVRAVTKLHGMRSGTQAVLTRPPFRSPHHRLSVTALLGGGTIPTPGEVSLAHAGVLFIDEIAECRREVLEALRGPLEHRVVHVSRLYGGSSFPADCMLVATMNPCPCGYYGSAIPCRCAAYQRVAYLHKLSGPLLDRIDLIVPVHQTDIHTPIRTKKVYKTQQDTVVGSVIDAKNIQKKRYNSSIIYNANLSARTVRQLVLSPNARNLLQAATKKLQLSHRTYFKIIKVARTIADLEQHAHIEASDISEALSLRGQLPAQ